MKRKTIIFIIFLAVILLAACGSTTSDTTNSSFHSSTSIPDSDPDSIPITSLNQKDSSSSVVTDSSSAPSSSDSFTSADETSSLTTQQDNQQPIVSTLDFLTPEQQQLYQNAFDISYALFGVGTSISSIWDYHIISNEDWLAIFVGGEYNLYEESYQEFDTRMRAIFTDAFLRTTDYSKKFIDYNGELAVHYSMHRATLTDVSIYTEENFPDSYQLIDKADDSLTFSLISHYDKNNSAEGKQDPDIYTIAYPIRMILTEDGWRIDEFHTTRFG